MKNNTKTPAAAILLVITTVISLFSGNFGFSSLLGIAVNFALCYVIFTKKRNNLTVIVVALYTLPKLLPLLSSFSFVNLLSALSSAMLFIIALTHCDQTMVKADLTKLRTFSAKYAWLAPVLAGASYVFSLFNLIQYGYLGSILLPYLLALVLNVIIVHSLASWLKSYTPVKMPAPKKEPVAPPVEEKPEEPEEEKEPVEEQVARYKRLLENGDITQEEYDAVVELLTNNK